MTGKNAYPKPTANMINKTKIFWAFALKIETETGYYECKKCHHKYIPSYKSVYFAMHYGTTRYLKCPKCHRKSWNKKVMK